MNDEDEKPKKIEPNWLSGKDQVSEGSRRVRKSRKHERRLAEQLGGKRLPGSGNQAWSRNERGKKSMVTGGADIESPSLVLEHKYTEKESLSLKREWLEKITVAASMRAKTPGVVITFDGARDIEKDWVLVPLSYFQAFGVELDVK